MYVQYCNVVPESTRHLPVPVRSAVFPLRAGVKREEGFLKREKTSLLLHIIHDTTAPTTNNAFLHPVQWQGSATPS